MIVGGGTGGAPLVWFTDPRLAGAPFGVNGIRTDKNNKMVYVSVSLCVSDSQGVIYRLPLVAAPTAADLEEFAVTGISGPGGIAFGKSGKLCVTEALSSTIKGLNPDGSVDATYHGPALNPPGAPVPWTNPAHRFRRPGRDASGHEPRQPGAL